MTEIEWLDGRVTKVPELALGDAFGESVQAELDFGFDDVLEGLWVEVRHHEPDEDSDGDPRGRGCALYADCRYSLVEPSDLDRVFCILYEGQPRVCRVAGELVNLLRACALSCLMLGSPYPPGALEALAACAGLATLMWTVPGGAQETGGPYMRDPRHPRHFTDEFKRQIVDLYNAGKPKREIMDEYDLGKSTVERWIKSINATGSPRAACNRTPEQNRILELERENRRLRMEVDVLKQAALIYARK